MPRAIDIVRRTAPRALPAYLAAFERGDVLLQKYGIMTPLRLAHFLAQVLHESGALTIEWESMNYRTAARLMEIFGEGRHSAAVTWPEVSGLLGNPQALAERVYGLGNPEKARDGLGNTQPGDGYGYRGGGILQTTGRANYRRMAEKCGVDFEAHPELVVSAEHALKPALAEWGEGDLNRAADRDDIEAITRRINGGYNGLAERRGWLAKLKPMITSVEFALASVPVQPPLQPAPPPAKPQQSAPPTAAAAPAQADLARRIVGAMEHKGYRLDRGPGEINVVYVEGLSPNGVANDNADNEWNDLRLVIRFEDGQPKIAGSWVATTGPGRYYVDNPINPAGAARIEFGQYCAWQVGIHRGDHEALVQTGGAVTVCRDLNEDGERTGDKRDTGYFGINQHWGYDLAQVDRASAGCLVGQSRTGHREFMAIVKSDPRYKADPEFVFTTAILAADDLAALPPPVSAGAPAPSIPSPPAQVPPGAPPAAAGPPLRGDPLVCRVQRILGFAGDDVDGEFGAATEAAIKQFQIAHWLDPTGEVDGPTWALLDHAEMEQHTSPDLRGDPLHYRVQRLLGFQGDNLDGEWGQRTRAAVMRFQSEQGLDADGEVGPLTSAALDRLAGVQAAPGASPRPPPTAPPPASPQRPSATAPASSGLFSCEAPCLRLSNCCCRSSLKLLARSSPTRGRPPKSMPSCRRH